MLVADGLVRRVFGGDDVTITGLGHWISGYPQRQQIGVDRSTILVMMKEEL